MNSATKNILTATVSIYKKSADKLNILKYVEGSISKYEPLTDQGIYYAKNELLAAKLFLRIFKPKQMADNTVNHGERAHALLSASGASRWIACTPSARLEEQFENRGSSFAEEGTLAHEFAELNLKLKGEIGLIDRYEHEALCAPLKQSPYYSLEMEEHVQKHISYVIEQYTEAQRVTPDAVLLIEQRVDITHLIEEGFGTCDIIIIADGVLEVIDLKYGAGVRVSAENNSQLKLYGSGALEAYEMLYDIHTVRLTITQPRMDSISSWEISADDLRTWGEEVVKPKALQAYAGEGAQVPGEHCRFCRASAKCRAQADIALQTAKDDFTDPRLLTDSELVEVYKKAPQVEAWLKSVAGFMFEEALAGKTWPDLKLVEGQCRRGWTDEQAVIMKLKKDYKATDIGNFKVKGIGEVEKLVGKKNFTSLLGDLVVFKKTSPSLVPVSDKRPAMSSTDSAKSDFAE